MTHNCANTTRLLSDAQDRGLVEEERQHIEKHLEICPSCVRFQDHMAMLRVFMHRLRAGLGDEAVGEIASHDPPR
jgi:hypothetical protein